MLNSIELLEQLKTSGVIVPLDFHLALFFINKSNLAHPLQRNQLAFLIAWISVEIRAGHVCINLAEITKQNLAYRLGSELAQSIFAQLDNPKLEDWLGLCEKVGDEMIGNGETMVPFVLQFNQLYFQRMWLYEKRVADYFATALQTYTPDIQMMRKLLQELFPLSHHNDGIDWQKIAVVSALTRKITIISGGPGTGKTTTIGKILVALITIHQIENQTKLRIVATAPTGKAAARLTESLSIAVSALTIPQPIKDSLPMEAITLHRLLGARSNSNQYLYHKNNPLNIDILLIDEASMVDLPMMSKVIEALPDHCRVILLGDKEQLSSVEAGAVFGDLCDLNNQGYSQEHVQMISNVTGYQLVAKQLHPSIADSVCLLQKSYRFNRNSGIGVLASLIKEGQHNTAVQLFDNMQYQDIEFNHLTCHKEYLQAIDWCVSEYQNYLQVIKQQPIDIKAILSSFAQFRLLCALREGPFGVQGLNKIIEQKLNENNIINQHKRDAWYIGRPVMILRNSFSLGLFNGDIGITLSAPNDNKLKVYFLLPNGEIKGFSPFRLPEHETAYAMTIHKSQGSEFEHVNIILPNEYSPLLTRSLLYTAVTRAKKQLSIYSDSKILEQVIKSKTYRQSGLLRQIARCTSNINSD